MVLYRYKKSVMIMEWQRSGNYWTNTGSPDFVRGPELRGYLESHGRMLLHLSGVKKNYMRLLWHGTLEFLRQEGSTYSGLTMRREAHLSGDGDPACTVPEMWEGEAGEDRVVVRQSFLHKEVLPFCRKEVPDNDYTGRSQRGTAGLAYGEGAGQAVHGGAA